MTLAADRELAVRRVCYRGHLHRCARQRVWPGRRRTELLLPRRTAGAGRRGVPPAAERPGSAGRGRRGRRHAASSLDIDLTDERSLSAAVRDAVAAAQPGAALTRPLTAPRGTVVVVTDAPAMSWLQVVVLSVLQGLTEFLPVSSSGHLAIASRLFFDDDAGASFTAVTQLGTELAVLVYFARDIGRIVQGLVRRTVRRRAPQRRLLAGLVRDHRHHPDRGVRAAVQGRHPHRRAQSVDRRHRADRVLGRHRRRRVLRPADPPRRAADLAGRRHRRPGAVPGAGARACRGPARPSAPGCSWAWTARLAARFGFLLAIPAVFASGLFSLPDAFHPVGEGMSATGPQLLVATVHRVRGRLRRGGVVPEVPGAPQHVLVRRLPGAARRASC